MANPEKQQGISTEVVGIFSQPQQAEFAYLANQILEARGGNLQKDEDVENASLVSTDCIQRGLKSLGKTWFTSPEESITDAFDIGLSERERISTNIAKLNTSPQSRRLLSDSEEATAEELANKTNPLSSNETIQDSEMFLREISERSRQIDNLHRLLFDESSLAPQSRLLQNAALDRSVATIERTSQQDIRDAIFRNLIVNLTLYPGSNQPSLFIELEDIAAVVDLWKDTSIRTTANTRIIEGIQALAKRFGVDEKAVAVYTERMISDIDALVISGIDAHSLKNSSTFVIADKTSDTAATTEITTVIPEQTILEAQAKFQRLTYIQNTMRAQPIDNKTLRHLVDEEINIVSSLSPHELLYLLQTTSQGTVNLETRRILIDTPISTFNDTLLLVYTKIAGSSNQDMSKIVSIMEAQALSHVKLGRIKLDQPNLPIPFLSKVIQEVDLDKGQEQALLRRTPSFWIEACITSGVTFMSILENDFSLDNLSFPPGTERLIHFIKQMPISTQETIIKGIRQEITF